MSAPDVRCGPGASLADNRAAVERHLAAGEFLRLDLHDPSEEDAVLLAELFGFHDLAMEDVRNFGQRPKVDEYDDFALLVVHGAADDEDRMVEVHCLYSDRFLVTVHRDHAPALEEMHRHRDREPTEPIRMLHHVVDVLSDSFFPLLQEFDDQLDALDADLDARVPKPGTEQRIFAMKRRLATFRRVIGPQRDLLARLAGGLVELPGLTPDAERYFRDVYDHLIRLGDLIESYRDLLSGATDVHLTAVSNRLNEVTKQLAVVATVFLPLSFITGFFGQNFGWMVDHIGSPWAFLLLGIGTQVLAVVALLVWFRRRGWLS